MSQAHSVMTVETCRMAANITLITDCADERLTKALHEICHAAVKRAIRPLGRDVDPAERTTED